MNVSKVFSSIRKLYWRKTKPDFGKYKIVKPGKVSPRKFIPDHIPKPSYHITGEPTEFIDYPEIKNEQQINKMRDSCRLAANLLNEIGKNIKVGQTTEEIDNWMYDMCIRKGVYPSPLNYKHFPKTLCTSVNNVACHGIPDDRPLEDGDIITVDVTVFHNGYHGDCARTFLVGNVDDEGKDLVNAAEICVNESIKVCKHGQHFRTIGAFIYARARQLGFGVIPAFIGHGIGCYFHGPPDIYNIRNNYPGIMEAGMTFTIEPILTQGGDLVEILEDDWTAVTFDNARTAQFEHTVLVTYSGAEILTLPS